MQDIKHDNWCDQKFIYRNLFSSKNWSPNLVVVCKLYPSYKNNYWSNEKLRIKSGDNILDQWGESFASADPELANQRRLFSSWKMATKGNMKVYKMDV